MVQYKAFWFLGFEDDFWDASSVTVHASLDTILEARSHFAQRFRGNRLNFLSNGVLQIINLFVAHREHSSFQKPPEMSRELACFRADNRGVFAYSRTNLVNLVRGSCWQWWILWLISVLLLLLCFWSSPPTLKSICGLLRWIYEVVAETCMEI